MISDRSDDRESMDELDRLLDEYLSRYSQAEPSPGLEARVLAKVRASRPDRHLRFLTWATAACLAAGVAALLLIQPHPDVHTPESHSAIAINRPSVLDKNQAAPATVAVARRRPARHVLPRLAVFPNPSPLTAEERRAIAFVQRSSPEHNQVLLSAASPDLESLQIAELEIKPLDSGQEQEQKK